MYFKSAMLVVFLAALGAGVVVLRQQRWEVKHEIAQMHRQIEQTRRATWESQQRVAANLKPKALEHKIAIANLQLEPVSATGDKAATPATMPGGRAPSAVAARRP
jgi:cell division protein FtsL